MNVYLIIISVWTQAWVGLTYINIIQCFLCGFLTLTALLFLNLAITQGYAGPVCALSATQNIFTTVLDVVFYSQIPNWYEIAGLIVGLVGAIAISLGPFFAKLCKRKTHKGQYIK